MLPILQQYPGCKGRIREVGKAHEKTATLGWPRIVALQHTEESYGQAGHRPAYGGNFPESVCHRPDGAGKNRLRPNIDYWIGTEFPAAWHVYCDTSHTDSTRGANMEDAILEILFGMALASVVPNALVAAWDLMQRTKWVRRNC